MRECNVAGCNNKHYGLGYCRAHHAQFKRNNKITKVKTKKLVKSKQKCIVDGCNNFNDSEGYCPKHSYQIKKHGKIMDQEYHIRKGKLCRVDGCENPNNKDRGGYCYKHSEQIKKYGQVLERTRFSPNRIIKYLTFAHIELYNIKNQIVCYAKIDLEDIDKIKKYKWGLSHGYVVTCQKKVFTNLADLVMNFKGNRKFQVDHINRDKLNNQKSNLRIVSARENILNREISKHKIVCEVF